MLWAWRARRDAARHLPSEAQLRPDAGARRRRGDEPGRSLRRAEARGAPAPLRLPPRDGRRAPELGGAEGPEPRSRREAARGPRRGSSARVRRLRRRHSRGRVRRRPRRPLGQRPMGAHRRPGRRLSTRQAQVHAGRREAARRVDARAYGRACGRGRQELAPPEGTRRGSALDERRRHPPRASRADHQRAPRAAARASRAAARHAGDGGAARRRVAARDQARRLPRDLPRRGRARAPLHAQRPGLDRSLRAGGACVRRAAGARGVSRRRGRGHGARRAHELRGPAGGTRRSARGRDALRRLRPAARERRRPAHAAAGAAEGAPRGPRPPCERCHAPLQRSCRRPRRRVSAARVWDGPRRRGVEASRRALARRPSRGLGEGALPAAAGVRDRRLHRSRRLAGRLRGAPVRRVGRRTARLHGAGGHRLLRADAARAPYGTHEPRAPDVAVRAVSRRPARNALGRARAGGRGHLHQLDPRRPAAPSGLRRSARGQVGACRRPRASRADGAAGARAAARGAR